MRKYVHKYRGTYIYTHFADYASTNGVRLKSASTRRAKSGDAFFPFLILSLTHVGIHLNDTNIFVKFKNARVLVRVQRYAIHTSVETLQRGGVYLCKGVYAKTKGVDIPTISLWTNEHTGLSRVVRFLFLLAKSSVTLCTRKQTYVYVNLYTHMQCAGFSSPFDSTDKRKFPFTGKTRADVKKKKKRVTTSSSGFDKLCFCLFRSFAFISYFAISENVRPYAQACMYIWAYMYATHTHRYVRAGMYAYALYALAHAPIVHSLNHMHPTRHNAARPFTVTSQFCIFPMRSFILFLLQLVCLRMPLPRSSPAFSSVQIA